MSWVSRGLASAVALVIVAVNYILLNEHCDLINNEVEKAQHLHILAGGLALAGVCLHVLMLRGCLKNPICRIVTAGIQLAAAGACIGAAYFVFANPCKGVGLVEHLARNVVGQESNIFKVEDKKMITIFVLDIVGALVVGGSTFLRSS